MFNIEINEFTRRFLLLIYFLGFINEENQRIIKTKKRFLKLYYLSTNPEILKKVLSFLNLEENIVQESFIRKIKDTFFIFIHGVYLKNFANKISEAIRYDLIKIEKIGRNNMYILTKKGIELIRQIEEENNPKTQKYISNLRKITPLKEISTKELTRIIDMIIEKDKRKLGSRV